MPGSILRGKRVLITQADAFMGPVLCEVFAEQGASVISNTEPLIDPQAPGAVVTAAGLIDVLVVNLAVPAPSTPATEVTDLEWRDTFASLVDPLPRLFRAVLPQMKTAPKQALESALVTKTFHEGDPLAQTP